jgi:hypothetical protein
MVYCTIAQAKEYCKQLKDITDVEVTANIESVTNEDINPTLSKQYDITSSEVTSSKLVCEVTAMGAGLKALETGYASNQRSGLSADIQELKRKYNLLIFEISTGKKKV